MTTCMYVGRWVGRLAGRQVGRYVRLHIYMRIYIYSECSSSVLLMYIFMSVYCVFMHLSA